MAETVMYVPENSGNSVPAWTLMQNGGLFGGNSGVAGAGLGFLFGLLFGNGGFGNLGGNRSNQGAAEAAFVSNQMNNEAGRALLMNAVTSQGESSRAAVQNLATMVGQDFNVLNGNVQMLSSGLSALALQQAVSVPEIINAIQSGNTSLMSQLAQCCCENRLLTTQQGYESQIRTLEQTNQLGAQADRNANAIIGAINAQTVAMNDQFCAAKERDMQAEINRQGDLITQLRNQISNDKQTEAFTAAFNALNQKITDLAARQPNTVPVQWPALTAVNTTPYVNGGYYGQAFGYGSGINF